MRCLRATTGDLECLARSCNRHENTLVNEIFFVWSCELHQEAERAVESQEHAVPGDSGTQPQPSLRWRCSPITCRDGAGSFTEVLPAYGCS